MSPSLFDGVSVPQLREQARIPRDFSQMEAINVLEKKPTNPLVQPGGTPDHVPAVTRIRMPPFDRNMYPSFTVQKNSILHPESHHLDVLFAFDHDRGDPLNLTQHTSAPCCLGTYCLALQLRVLVRSQNSTLTITWTSLHCQLLRQCADHIWPRPLSMCCSCSRQ